MSSSPPSTPTRPTATAVRAFACSAFLLAALTALAQAPASAPQPRASTSAAQPSAPGASGAARPAMKVASVPKANGKAAASTKPTWRELTPAQQQSLSPLAAKWDTLNEAQKRKWIALSANFPRMSAEEQAKLHSRMTEWVALSPQQRTLARLNFGETRQLSADDKKAKWEAYQALSPEEKKKLAAGATKPPTTAAAVKPVGPDKLAVVPKPPHRTEARTPRIAAAPDQVDHNTLLPQQPPGGPGAQQ